VASILLDGLIKYSDVLVQQSPTLADFTIFNKLKRLLSVTVLPGYQMGTHSGTELGTCSNTTHNTQRDRSR